MPSSASIEKSDAPVSDVGLVDHFKGNCTQNRHACKVTVCHTRELLGACYSRIAFGEGAGRVLVRPLVVNDSKFHSVPGSQVIRIIALVLGHVEEQLLSIISGIKVDESIVAFDRIDRRLRTDKL